MRQTFSSLTFSVELRSPISRAALTSQQSRCWHLAWLLLTLLLACLLGGCAQQGKQVVGEPALYLRGEFNDWLSEDDQFHYEGRGLYVLEKSFDSGLYRFQIADRNWSCFSSYGYQSQLPNQTVQPGTSIILESCAGNTAWNKLNSQINLRIDERATYFLALKTESTPPRLVIVKMER